MAKKEMFETSNDFSYYSLSLSVGEYYKAYVMTVTCSKRFYIQTKENREHFNWDRLKEELDRYYCNQKEIAKYLKPGTPCLAYNGEKMCFSRGVIRKMNDKAFIVYFVDFGNIEIKDGKEIYVLPDKFANIPILAHECVLEDQFSSIDLQNLENKEVEILVMTDVLPHKVKFRTDKATRSQYKKVSMVSGNRYPIEVVHIKNPCSFYVRLAMYEEKYNLLDAQLQMVCDENVNEVMKEYVEGPCCVYSSDDQKWFRGDIICANGGLCQISYVDTGVREVVSKGLLIRAISPEYVDILPALAIPCSLAYIPKDIMKFQTVEAKQLFINLVAGQKSLNANVFEIKDGLAEVQLSYNEDSKLSMNVNNEILERLVLGGLKITVPKPDVRKVENIFVTYCQSMRHFFGQLNRVELEVLDNLHQNLQEYGNSLMVQEGQLSLGKSGNVGDFCLTPFSVDHNFYRGKVISGSSDTMDILFIDYGNTETVSSTLVKQLPNALAIEPAMGIMCSSVDCKTFDSDPKEIKNALLNQNVEVEIIKEENGVYDVHFTNSTVNANIRRFLALKEDSISKPTSRRPPPVIQRYTSLNHDLVESILFIHMQSWRKFYVHLTKYEYDVLELASEIERELIRNPQFASLDKIAIGMPCLALYSERNQWYRAIILKLMSHENDIKVEFVDFGNRENVPLSNIRLMPDRLMKKPKLSIECTLSDHPDFEMPDDLLMEFEKEAVETTFLLRFDGGVDSLEPKKVTFIDDFGKSLIGTLGSEAMSRFQRNSPRDSYRNYGENRHRNFSDDRGIGKSDHWEGGNNNGRNTGGFGSRYLSNANDQRGVETRTYTWNQRRGDSNDERDKNENRNEMDRHDKATRSPSECSDSSKKQWCSRQTYTNTNRDNVNWKKPNSNEAVRDNCVFRQDLSRNVNGDQNFKRDVPPRFRNKSDRGSTWQPDFNCEIDRKYESRQFYPKEESWNSGRHDGAEDDWNNGIPGNGNFDRKPITYINNNYSKGDSIGIQNVMECHAKNLKCIPQPELVPCTVEIGSYKDVTVVYVVNPNEFYCNFLDPSANVKYLEMSKKLNSKCNEDLVQSLSSPKAGTLCSAMYSDDGNWYRAKIINVIGEEVEVFFIDYGNSGICLISSLKVLEEEFRVLPQRAIKCSLFDIKSSTGKDWTSIESDSFENAVLQSQFLANFKSKSEAGAYIVDLIDSSVLSDFSIRYKLMKENNFKPVTTTEKVYLELFNCLSHLSTYETINLDVGQKLQAFVTWINSPEDFYVQVIGENVNFGKFENELNQFYQKRSKEELVLREPEIGISCVAPFEFGERRDWYRAFILAIDGDQLIVHYVDYGNIGLVSIEETKQIVPEFQKLPAQAVRFRLNGVRPFGSRKDICYKELEDYYSGDLECTIVEKSDGKLIVDVMSAGKSVADELINGGCTASGDKITLESSAIIKELVRKLMGMPVVSSEVSTLTATISEALEPVTPASTEEGSVSEAAKLPDHAFSTDTIRATFVAEESNSFAASVSFVNSVNDFWIQRCSDIDKIEELSANLNEQYNDSQAEESISLKAGDMCVAQFSEDGNWYRASVLGERDFGLSLLYVDYGNTDWVTLDAVRLIPDLADWIAIPPYAINCSLIGVEAGKCDLNVTDTFNSILERSDHEVEVVITKCVGDKSFVELKSLGEDIANSVALKSCLESAVTISNQESVVTNSNQEPVVTDSIQEAVVTDSIQEPMVAGSNQQSSVTDINLESTEEFCDKFAVSEKPQRSLLKIDELRMRGVLNVLVSYIKSPSDFWLQIVEDQEELQQLISHLEICSEKADVIDPGSLKIGSVVLARYGDGYWYRAVVNQISDTVIGVDFVDYGNSDNVVIEDLRVLPEEFFNIPAMAFQCNLNDVHEPEDGWSSEVLDLFHSFESDCKVLQAEIVKAINAIYFVELSDGSKNYNESLRDRNNGSNENIDTPKEFEVSVSTTFNDVQEDAVEVVLLDSSTSTDSSHESTDLYIGESSSKFNLGAVKDKIDDAVENFNSSDTNDVISNEAEIDILNEKFATQLKVPSYTEFVEVASHHMRSLSPPPSLMGNSSGNETLFTIDNQEFQSSEGAVNSGHLEDIIEESSDVQIEADSSNASNISIPEDHSSSENDSDSSSTVKDSSAESEKDVEAISAAK